MQRQLQISPPTSSKDLILTTAAGKTHGPTAELETRDILLKLQETLGSKEAVYQTINLAIKKDAVAMTQLANMLGSRALRISIVKSMRTPTFLPELLTYICGSRSILRSRLEKICDGEAMVFEMLAETIDSEASIYKFIEAYKSARRECMLIIQSYIPILETSSRIIDMIFDKDLSAQKIADVINGFSHKQSTQVVRAKSRNIPLIDSKTVELISDCLFTCDIERLKELQWIRRPENENKEVRKTT